MESGLFPWLRLDLTSHLSPHLCLHPTPPPQIPLLKIGWDWKLLCDCQRWQVPCPTVLLSVRFVCMSISCAFVWVWAPPGPELLWSRLGGCRAPTAVALRVFRKDKKQQREKRRKKKILVVYKLICFHGFVFLKRESRSSQCWLSAQLLYALGKPYNTMTKPINCMEGGRRTCIVLYRNEIFYMRQVSLQ